MSRSGRLLLFALLLLHVQRAFAEPPPAELLQKLAAHQARLEALGKRMEVTMQARSEELDKAGKAVGVEETVVRFYVQDGKDVSELVRAVKDGKDVTAERRREERKKKKGEGTFSFSDAFAADQQKRFRFELKGAVPGAPGQVRVAFAPLEPSQQLLEGEALVDEAAGEVIAVKAHPSELPMLADRADVAVDYGAKTDAGRTLSRIVIQGEGGILFLRKRVRATITLSYAPRGEAAEGQARP